MPKYCFQIIPNFRLYIIFLKQRQFDVHRIAYNKENKKIINKAKNGIMP